MEDIDNPHDDSADQQRTAHDIETLEVLADDLGKKKCRNGSEQKCNENESEWMRKNRAISAFATRKCTQEFGNARTKINRQAEDGPELNHNGVHLPEAVGKINAKEGLTDPQMGGRADGQKFGKALDSA